MPEIDLQIPWCSVGHLEWGNGTTFEPQVKPHPEPPKPNPLNKKQHPGPCQVGVTKTNSHPPGKGALSSTTALKPSPSGHISGAQSACD